MAHAADPGKPASNRVAASAVDLDKAAASSFKKFTSPADKSVRKTLPTAQGKAATAQAQGAAVGNPDLAMILNASGETAHGLTLDTEIISASASLSITIEWGDGKKDTTTAGGSTTLTNSHTYAELGEYTVKVTVTDAANQAEIVNTLPIQTAGSDFTPYGPTRLLDTRSGIGATKGKVPARGTAHLKVGGNGGIPNGVTAVVLNVTATNTTQAGHVTVFGSGHEQPITSNVNFEAGQTVPNLVIVPVGKDGYVELFNGGWESIDLLADVTGYFTRSAASGYTSMNPTRFVDSREGLGTSKGQVAGQSVFSTQISGLRGVPQGITAVALNVTVTNPKETGHLTVFPSGQSAPSTSSVNFTAGQTIANSVIVPVGPDGKISIRNGAWAGADVIVDVVGHYSQASNGAYVPVSPGRLIDSRDPASPIYGELPGRMYFALEMPGYEAGIAGYVLNTTVTNTQGAGFLSVAPDPNSIEDYWDGVAVEPARPGASTLNWTAGKTVPNLVQAGTGPFGVVDFWNQGWEPTDLIVDMFGYYETK
ncbi:PKD domain-containing protein [Streptomyces sp. IBSNAI002]|uniref:PKD domain-containing protein n=1 Tax=Streptomyces sp. IBSNAI002 TaxID=3457500 RepID=UPI003FD62361